jgi:SAM-dependent methyltransferase
MNIKRWEEAHLGQRRSLRRREKRIKLFNIDENKSILDCGCGDGLDLMVFKRLGYKNIAGLDTSEDYLSRIKNEFKVFQADICDTGLPTDSFDVVFIDGAFHHFDYYRALQEIKRILKFGGELCLIEPRATLARKILDFITLSPILAPFGYLKKRRISLIEEREMYETWLRQQPFLISMLERFKFRVIFRKETWSTIIVKCLSQ